MGSRNLFFIGAIGAFGIWAGFPNNFWQFPPAVFLWPLALVILGVLATRPTYALRFGWLCTFCGMCGALYWLYLPVYSVGQLPVIAAMGCALFICACLALQGAFFCVGVFLLKKSAPFTFCCELAILWYLLEYFFAILVGVPWLPLCGAFPRWPFLLQGASFVGGYALGGIWLIGFLLILSGFFPTVPDKKISSRLICSGSCLLLALTLFGIWRLSAIPPDPLQNAENTMNALFVEGNVDQNQKWEPAFQTSTLELYMDLTIEGLAGLSHEERENLLVLWPETALPFFLELNRPLARQLSNFVKEARVPLLFGAPGMEEGKSIKESAIFNRAFLLQPDGRISSFYDKKHLVPFGEYVPSFLKLEFLEPLLQGVGIYEQGQDSSPLRFQSLALGMLICYEGIFPWLARERVAHGANILVDISNDGWFGKSPAALQHLYLTIVRCVEQNRWLLRSTNTGLSAIADNLGRIRLLGSMFKRGTLSGKATLLKDKSVYYHLADYLPWFFLAIFGILILCQVKEQRYTRKNSNSMTPPNQFS